MSCDDTARAQSDDLSGLLADDERRAFDDHVKACSACAHTADQLRTTVGVLRGRLDGPLSLPEPGGPAPARRVGPLAAQLQRPGALAREEVNCTIGANPAPAMTPCAGNGGSGAASPTTPPTARDPDVDEAELSSPEMHNEDPQRAAWMVTSVSSSEERSRGPDADLLASDVYSAVDGALCGLDPIEADLIALVDIEGAPFARAVLDLDLPFGDARDRLTRARLGLRDALEPYIRS